LNAVTRSPASVIVVVVSPCLDRMQNDFHPQKQSKVLDRGGRGLIFICICCECVDVSVDVSIQNKLLKSLFEMETEVDIDLDLNLELVR
jgi:hypothetical protein